MGARGTSGICGGWRSARRMCGSLSDRFFRADRIPRLCAATTWAFCAVLGAGAMTFVSESLLAQKPSPEMGAMPGMTMSGTVGVPMERNASGTSWIPDAIPEPAHQWKSGGWDLMLHGFAFAQYNTQGG